VVFTSESSGMAGTPTPGVPPPPNPNPTNPVPPFPGGVTATPGGGFPTPPAPPLALLAPGDVAGVLPREAVRAQGWQLNEVAPAQPPFPTPPGPPGQATATSTLMPPPPTATATGVGPTATSIFPTPGGGATNTPVTPGPTATIDPGASTATPPAVVTPGVPPGATVGQRDIFGMWVSESGVRVTNVFGIIGSPADDTYPSLAYRRQGTQDQWALVWREVTGLNTAISAVELTGYGRFFTYSSGKGNVVGGGDQGRPSVATEFSGEFLVAWSETPTGQDDRDIYGRRLNANSFPVGPIIKLVDGPADQVYPSLASLGSAGGYLVAWEERAVGAPPDIRVRRLNRNGIPLRAAYDVAGGPPFSFAPSLPSVERSTTLLVWIDRNAASDHSIVGAEVTRDGRRIGPERVIVQGGSGPSPLTPVVPPPGFPTPAPFPTPPIP
jgi:hypothetical protein